MSPAAAEALRAQRDDIEQLGKLGEQIMHVTGGADPLTEKYRQLRDVISEASKVRDVISEASKVPQMPDLATYQSPWVRDLAAARQPEQLLAHFTPPAVAVVDAIEELMRQGEEHARAVELRESRSRVREYILVALGVICATAAVVAAFVAVTAAP